MFSKFTKRFKKEGKTKNIQKEFTKDEADYILLVGSESGNTEKLAKAFMKAMIEAGKKIHMDDLDSYDTYDNASHLIIFSSTFGDGDAPGTAMDFEDKFNEIDPKNLMQYSVVGFGSTLYPTFCQFAVDIDQWLREHPKFEEATPLVKINRQSASEFRSWISSWNKVAGTNIDVKLPEIKRKSLKSVMLTVVSCSDTSIDDTALIQLQPKKNVRFQSGDLLQIIPEGEKKPRWYSIARIGEDILLSVRNHEQGICSQLLCGLKEGDTITGAIERNDKFHFPSEAPSVWMIGNGTGIAPYLGMLKENEGTTVHLSWGGKTEQSFERYKDHVEEAYENGLLESYHLAFSRVGAGEYVQDQLKKQAEKIANVFDEGGIFMLCGSMAMQNGVLKVLDEITQTHLNSPLSSYQQDGQLLSDCY